MVGTLVGASLARGQSLPLVNMGYSGAGNRLDLLKVIDRAGLWRKHGIDVRTIYLSERHADGADALLRRYRRRRDSTPGDAQSRVGRPQSESHRGADQPSRTFFVVRNNIKTPADLKGKKVTISRYGSGSDTHDAGRLAILETRPGKGCQFFSIRKHADAYGGIDRGPYGRALVSSTGVAKIVATGCCRVLAISPKCR